MRRTTAAAGASVVGFAAWSRFLRISERPSWPPPDDAYTADQARDLVDQFALVARRPREVGIHFAPSTAASIEPWAGGTEFYPRIRADIAAAEHSVHILMFGWKPGEVGDDLANVLVGKLGEGVQVRILVDSLGSRPGGLSAEMFGRLVDAGAELVVNDLLPIDRRGAEPERVVDWRHPDTGAADHRKLYVIDGRIAWTGGAGIEDHFLNGEFHDVMVQVTGDVVRQAQALFLASFLSHGGDRPSGLPDYFPEPSDNGAVPVSLVHVVPGGFVSATQATRELIDGATERLDIMNPYLTDRDMIDRIVRAAQRGVRVRIVLSERSNNTLASAAVRHHYRRLQDAGVEIWEYPGAVVHAKVVVADDTVQFGTLNLDAWALYRDFEVAMIAESAELAARFEERLIEPDIAASRPGLAPDGAVAQAMSWASDRISYFL